MGEMDRASWVGAEFAGASWVGEGLVGAELLRAVPLHREHGRFRGH
jgi:hypothetical protein